MLYRPVEQGDVAPDYALSTPTVTPKMAQEWLDLSDKDETFKNRTTRTIDVRRWKLLMETGRFVQWMPDGPILRDQNGILLNGKHRLTALIGNGQPLGFVVISGVPRWMMRFFDTGRSRSLRDVFEISGRMPQAQTGSTVRLAMRYEEFLCGKRRGTGWKQWPQQKDEHTDVDSYLARRQQLADLYGSGDKLYRGARLLIASGMVFRFFQELAWPEGEPALLSFWTGLCDGANLAPERPALVLREWARDMFYDKVRIEAKRESHLLLLLRMFALHAQDDRVRRVQYGYGQPMPMPYHPDGPGVALVNIKNALAEMDAEYDKAHTPEPAKVKKTTRKAPQTT